MGGFWVQDVAVPGSKTHVRSRFGSRFCYPTPYLQIPSEAATSSEFRTASVWGSLVAATEPWGCCEAFAFAVLWACRGGNQ